MEFRCFYPDAAGNFDVGAGPSLPVTVDNNAPNVSIGTPSLSVMNQSGSVTFPLTYEVAPTSLTIADFVILGDWPGCILNLYDASTTTPYVTVTGCSSSTGSIRISVAAGNSQDAAGNLDAGAGPSSSVNIDNIDPAVSIGSASAADVNALGTVSFTLTYSDPPTGLTSGDISFEGTATGCSVNIIDALTTTPDVEVSGCSGNGSFRINVAAGNAVDAAGNTDNGAGPSAWVNVDNIAPTVSIGAPNKTAINSSTSVRYTLSYDSIPSTLDSSDVSVNGTNSGCWVSVLDSATFTPDVYVQGCNGNGSISISLASGTSQDAAGNQDAGDITSGSVTIDNIAPTVTIGEPSVSSISSSDTVTYPLYYQFVPTAFNSGYITINGDHWDCTTTIRDAATTTPKVDISGCSSLLGQISISVDPGRSQDAAGNADSGDSTSTAVDIDNFAPAPTDFSTTWRITSSNETLTLPGVCCYTYNYAIDWGDGTKEALGLRNPSHVYSSPGDYTIRIAGTFPAFSINYDASIRDKLIHVNNLGDVGWTSLSAAFMGALQMESFTANSYTNTSNVTSMRDMFRISGVTDATISLDLRNLDTSNVTSMYYMFMNAHWDAIDVSTWNTANVSDMDNMFSGFYGPTVMDLSSFDTSNVTNMRSLFSNSNATTLDISNFNTERVQSFDSTFFSAKAPLNLSGFNTSNATTMYQMFYIWTGSTTLNVSSFNTSNVQWMGRMFSGTVLEELDVSGFDISSLSAGVNMFNTSTLTSIDFTGWLDDEWPGMTPLSGTTGLGSSPNKNIICDDPSGTLFGENCGDL